MTGFSHLHTHLLQYLLNGYYIVKPVVPDRVKFTLRHIYATTLRRTIPKEWPINPASSGTPVNWPGWPDGKRFAFVLSHDVEGTKGLNRCRAVAELEMEQGFRSSFNFVPEGEYDTPDELRFFLRDHGFEIGVHDLHHDGSLYRSQRSLRDATAKINHYLKEWGASGFRSGFMRHDLEWLGELDIRYDASTFEYDPFEPQPDGTSTIFPFWVRRPDGTGFVELPYTLPQDSTLFLVLREKGNDLWKRKLDWVAAQGGMAFMIVHPDYIAFNEAPTSVQYATSQYRDFLEYAKLRYSDTAWFARPQDVENHIRQHLPLPEVAGTAISPEFLRR